MMIELFFDQSTCNSLRMAMMNSRGCEVYTIYAGIDKIDQNDTTEEATYENGNCKPISGEFSDVFGLQLGLSAGDISDRTGNQLELTFLYEVVDDSKRKKMMADMKADLDRIHQRLNTGEAIRIWYSDVPDDLCGFYWFMNQLELWGLSNVQVMTIRLPEWIINEQTVLRKYTWGEVLPNQWHPYMQLQKEMPKEVIKNYAAYWQKLQKENAPLRAVLNGKLVSVNEAFYDPFIEQCLMSMDNEFTEGQWISKVLSEQLGIGLSIIRSRIKAMIQEGKLVAIDDVKGDQRRLRKT